jgi:hypothetical protein
MEVLRRRLGRDTTASQMPDLESVISTAKLRRRPSRAPRDAAENRALVALAQAMTVSTTDILQKLVATASISRSIVEAYRGRLWGTPNAGHGATFQFVLPSCGRPTP